MPGRFCPCGSGGLGREERLKVEIKPLPPLDKMVSGGFYKIPDNMTIRQILEILGIPAREIREMRALLNGKHADMEACLEDGCTIVIIPTLAGG